MKVRQQANERFQQLKELPHFRTNAAIYLGLVALGRLRKIDDLRDIAPDPVDFFNHNGNVLSSVTAALIVSTAVHMRTEGNKSYLKTKILSASLASGAIINALVETRTGLGLPMVECMFDNCEPTADPIDYAYGMVGAAGGGVMAISMSKRKANPPDDRAPFSTHESNS